MLKIAFSVESELALYASLRFVRDQPMSLADASLVRLAELHDKPRV